MKEIIKLNKRLLAKAKEHLPEEGLMLNRKDNDDELKKIPQPLREEIENLCGELNDCIPDDFDYLLALGEEDTYFVLQYQNGQNVGGGGNKWNEDGSIFEQLRQLDWDERRAFYIQGTESFDHIIAVAKDLPVMIPSTKALQKQVGDQVKVYVKEKRSDASIVHALVWDGGDSLFDHDFQTMEDFQRELPDIMTHMVHVVAVVADGKPIPAEKIDALKKSALKKLEDMPISHAKASGKFVHIMSEAARLREECGGGSNE